MGRIAELPDHACPHWVLYPVVHPGISHSCLETVAVLQVSWSCKIAPRAQIGDALSRGILYLLTAQGSLLALDDAEI